MKRIKRTAKFKKLFRRLSPEIQTQFADKLKLLRNDPFHPSLRVHRVRSVPGLWEFSVTMSYRVLFEMQGDLLILHAVGPHDILP